MSQLSGFPRVLTLIAKALNYLSEKLYIPMSYCKIVLAVDILRLKAQNVLSLNIILK